MMKKFLYLTIAALALIACGDDDHEENNPPQEKQYTKLVTRANMDISQELFHIADITVYYMNEAGEVVNERMTSPVWEKTVTQPIPCKTGMAVTFTVKPDLNPTAEDKFDIKYSGELTTTPYTKNDDFIKHYTEVFGLDIKGLRGDKLAEILSHNTTKIGYTYTADGKQADTNIQWGF